MSGTGATLAVAFTAGLLAAVNPCGFALLPGYLGLFITGPDRSRPGTPPAVRALLAAGAMTVGFILVFTGFGLLAAPLAAALHTVLPWLTIVIGLIVAGLGGWMLAGRSVYLRVPMFRADLRGGSLLGAVGYGIAFAIASLSCTIGPFLALVIATFQLASVGAGIGAFVVYALGMGTVVAVVSVAVALTQQAAVRSARRALGVLSRVAGGLMVVTGLYVAWYGWYGIRIADGGSLDDPIIDVAEAVASALARTVGSLPWWGWLGLAALLIALTAAIGLRSSAKSAR